MNVQTKQTDQATALSDDLARITAEINTYKRIAGEAIFEIGGRLKEVRDNPEKYGLSGYRDWERWCERELDMTRQYANRFIKIYEEFRSPGKTSFRLSSVDALYLIATLPPEDRERPHVIPSTGEVKTVDEMTVRELREVKAELKREREARQRAEAERDQAIESAQVLRDTLESIQEQPQPIREVRTGTEISGRSLEFSGAVRDFIKKYSFLIHFDAEFASMNELSAREYEAAINGMYEFLDALSKRLPSRRGHKPVIINVS
jgi:hypothetical protein